MVLIREYHPVAIVVLALISKRLNIQIVLQVEFVLDHRILILQLHKSFQQISKEQISTEYQRSLIAYGALPTLMLRINSNIAIEIKAL